MLNLQQDSSWISAATSRANLDCTLESSRLARLRWSPTASTVRTLRQPAEQSGSSARTSAVLRHPVTPSTIGPRKQVGISMHAAVVSALLQIQALPDSSTTNDGGCPRTAPQLSDGKIRRAIQQGYNLNKLVVCNPHGQASHRFGDGGIKSVTSQIHPPKVTSSQLANTLLNSSKIDDSVVFHQICSLDRQNICGSDKAALSVQMDKLAQCKQVCNSETQKIEEFIKTGRKPFGA
ncbi:hypothetical protein T4E_6255 [Trichinella pseudospiralis]|uniref:Uncharacterized protein n=1 Tax=Trichinella pseudospiralis TaxID=6337 RepID=A0A0V0YBE9_TRIPS|nr:hypothetical protein T4E_6255 [Trichinella pseudospiralis]